MGGGGIRGNPGQFHKRPFPVPASAGAWSGVVLGSPEAYVCVDTRTRAHANDLEGTGGSFISPPFPSSSEHYRKFFHGPSVRSKPGIETFGARAHKTHAEHLMGFSGLLKTTNCPCLGAGNARFLFLGPRFLSSLGGLPSCGPKSIQVKNVVVRAHKTPAIF